MENQLNKQPDPQRSGLFALPDVHIVELTGDEFGTNLSKSELGKAADAYLKTLQHGSELLNNDTQWELKISKTGRKKMGDNANLTPVEIKAVARLEDLVKSAVLAETHKDYAHENESIENIHRLYAAMRIKQKLYRVKLTVKQYIGVKGKKNLHALAALEIENAPLPGTLPAPVTQFMRTQQAQPTTVERTISIAQLLIGAIRDSDGEPFQP